MTLCSLDIELTSRCILSCAACPRTTFTEKFNRPFPKMDLDNAALAAFLDCESGRAVEEFQVQGNHGDFIYYPELFEFIDYWRATKRFTFYTNGSSRNREWWEQFASRLTDKDTVFFSIDGIDATNTEYRVNSNWESILIGLDVVTKSPARVVWKTILFKTNQNQTNEISELAKSLGADEFVLEISHRFGNDEKFKPDKFIDLKSEKQASIIPKCKNYKKLYISADGLISPCCWVSTFNTLHQTEFWKQRAVWTIKNTTLDKFIQDQHLDIFVNKVESNYDLAYSVCKNNCNANRKHIKENEQRIQY